MSGERGEWETTRRAHPRLGVLPRDGSSTRRTPRPPPPSLSRSCPFECAVGAVAWGAALDRGEVGGRTPTHAPEVTSIEQRESLSNASGAWETEYRQRRSHRRRLAHCLWYELSSSSSPTLNVCRKKSGKKTAGQARPK